MFRRVVKLGGSLFDVGDLAERLCDWLADQTPADTVIVTGGGVLVDEIRKRHRDEGLSEHTSHWLSIQAMCETANDLRRKLPDAEWIDSVAVWREQAPHARLAILDPMHFLRREEPTLAAEPLPESWDVTSDSIAARFAVLANARSWYC